MREQIIQKSIQNKRIKTPCYLFDYDVLNSHLDNMLKIAGKHVEFCYAMKANPYLINDIDRKIKKIEVCSPGELEICRYYDIPGEHIIFSGVNKTKEDIEMAFSYPVDIITIESWKHFELVLDYCRERQCQAKILLRMTSGAQFGMEKKQIEEIISNRNEYSFLQIIGIHYFAGTQKKKIEKDKEELDELSKFLKELRIQYDYSPELLEYGPGLSVPYFEGDNFDQIYDNLQVLIEYVKKLELSCKVAFELGRFMVSQAGIYCTTVDDIKRNNEKNFCLVDGGIHQLNYYGQNMAMRTPIIVHIKKNSIIKQDIQEWCICGSLCTFADVLVRKVELDDLKIGDAFAFYNAGAYSVTEAPFLFLSRRMPEIYGYTESKGFVLVRKEINSHEINREEKY